MNAPVAIIGGGIIGCLCAYFLRELGHQGQITVIERDPSYRFSSTALSAASIRVQFGCPVNVELSLFGGEFLKSVQSRLDAEADIGMVDSGYLILGDATHAPARRDALAMQRGLGADVSSVCANELAARFPWLARDGIASATLGNRGEGWFDAWALLQAARRAAIGRGVTFVKAEATGLATAGSRITAVRLSDGGTIPADWCVNAAGALSGTVAGWLGIALPVAPKKRTVFHFKAPLDGRGLPMLFDTSGAWMRPEGDGFIAGIGLAAGSDPDAHGDFEPDHHLFEDRLWPLLAARVPAFERLRLQRAWAGHYEMNVFDHNGIVGPHDEIANLLFATGFSGHGVMHAPGVGRGIAERLVFGHYRSIDLSPLGYDRIKAGTPLPETAIY